MATDIPDDRLNGSISQDEYRRFCELIYRRTGLTFNEAKRYLVDRRVLDRMAKTGAGSVQSYLALLRFDTTGKELEAIVNSLTVNETYFWREDHQFSCLTNSILPDLMHRKSPGERFRIWSLPCSTGEEPYSIAIALLEGWYEVDAYDVEITGSDIDTEVLASARRGIYGARAVHRLAPEILARYFEPRADDQWQVISSLRASIDFTHANAADANSLGAYRNIDVIFCRNMLIYFDDASRRETAERLYACLQPGGYLCLGHSESMSRISSLFEVCRFPDAIVYQRPLK